MTCKVGMTYLLLFKYTTNCIITRNLKKLGYLFHTLNFLLAIMCYTIVKLLILLSSLSIA